MEGYDGPVDVDLQWLEDDFLLFTTSEALFLQSQRISLIKGILKQSKTHHARWKSLGDLLISKDRTPAGRNGETMAVGTLSKSLNDLRQLHLVLRRKAHDSSGAVRPYYEINKPMLVARGYGCLFEEDA
jgi:hypothetical protein